MYDEKIAELKRKIAKVKPGTIASQQLDMEIRNELFATLAYCAEAQLEKAALAAELKKLKTKSRIEARSLNTEIARLTTELKTLSLRSVEEK